jgi:hypothetical protein
MSIALISFYFLEYLNLIDENQSAVELPSLLNFLIVGMITNFILSMIILYLENSRLNFMMLASANALKIDHEKKQSLMSIKVKADFLDIINHEMRTPLNGIIGMSKLLLDTELNRQQKEMANTIIICSNNLLNLVNDTLDISKLESGKINLNLRTFNIVETISDAYSLLESQFKNKNIVFNIENLLDFSGWINADESRIKQILSNLLENAFKFTEKGTVTVRITNERQMNQSLSQKIIIVIKDTGLGISENDKKKLFQTFIKSDNFSTAQLKGAGLGLSISKELVKLMSGELWYESKLNIGSAFYFSISVSEIEAPTVPLENQIQIHKYPKLRILVVDDNKVNQMVALSYLKKMGYEPDIVSNGLEALKASKHNQYDLVLMDYLMPQMDGIQATIQIREHHKNKNYQPVIVAMTASVMGEDKDAYLRSGMNGFIPKPIKIKDIEKIIFEHFNQ